MYVPTDLYVHYIIKLMCFDKVQLTEKKCMLGSTVAVPVFAYKNVQTT